MSNMYLNVVSTFKGDGITSATRQLGAFGKQASGLGSVLGKVGTALASFGIAAKAIQFGRDSITASRDLERNLYALNTVFDDLAPGMVEFSKNAVEIGLSQSKAAKASVFIGSVLKQSGFEMSVVAKETQNLVALGTDLAALYGYDVQEALLGMTALFRGEYDPIEKFGVAMKQSEINAELAARGQNKLEGAARRNAEQTVRLELLYQRAADAIGSFKGQSGSLYTEQKKLGATFENVQATLGTALLPAIVDVNTELRKLLEESTPGLIATFEFLAQVIEGILGIFRDAIDPTTELGESFAALGIQLESLVKTIFGPDFDIAKVFEIASGAIGMFIDLLHDAMFIIERLVIGLQVMGQMAADFVTALTTGDWETFFKTDYQKKIKETIALTERTKDFKLQSEAASEAVKNLRDSVADADKAKLENLKQQLFGIRVSAKESANEMRRFREQAGLPAIAPKIETKPSADTSTTTSGGGTAKKEETVSSVLKQETLLAKRETKLLNKGVSAGFADLIVSTAKTKKAFQKELAKISTPAGLAKQQARFNKTAAGQRELAQIAAETARAAAEAAAELARSQEEAARAEAEALAERERVYNSFLDTVKGTFAGIKNAILGAFDITGLGGSTNSILRNMEKMLTRLRSFSASVKQLATMGLDPALLQQIIGMGPMAGATLASRLVAGGASALTSINTGYAEFGSLASQIAETGTMSLFNRQAQQNVYNINVNGGVGSGATIGKAIVDAIKDYERTSGAVWQGA